MSRAVQIQVPFLELLQATSVKQRKALLNTLTKDQFHALCEVIINVYKGNVPVSNYYVKKLFPFKRSIQMVADKHVSNPTDIVLYSQIYLHHRYKSYNFCLK